MPLLVNIGHLEHKNVILEGELSPEELRIENVDELVHTPNPVKYRLEVQKLEGDILVHGELKLTLRCDCARCLASYPYQLNFPNWAAHLPLSGEDQLALDGDCVDLTPYIREDILLAFPQHPLCKEECGGLENLPAAEAKSAGKEEVQQPLSPWAELNKLKFK